MKGGAEHVARARAENRETANEEGCGGGEENNMARYVDTWLRVDQETYADQMTVTSSRNV